MVGVRLKSSPADPARLDWGQRCRGESQARPAKPAPKPPPGLRPPAKAYSDFHQYRHCLRPEAKTGQLEQRRQKRTPTANRQVSVMQALYGDSEFRIGKGEIDNGREPVTLDLFGEETSYQFGEDQYAARQPERLAADAAVEPIEQIKPVHIRHARANPAAIR